MTTSIITQWPYNRYSTTHHNWRSTHHNTHQTFHRPLGLIERTFDADGLFFGGRADINAGLDVEFSSNLTRTELRARVLTAWTVLRLSHVLLMAKVVDGDVLGKNDDVMGENDMKGNLYASGERVFMIQVARNEREALEAASADLVFVNDQYPNVEYDEFYGHLQNTARVLRPQENLARLFVFLPSQATKGKGDGGGEEEFQTLRFIFVMAHQITDGLTNHTWLSHFLSLLNQTLPTLQRTISTVHTASHISRNLPSAQEDLYPALPTSLARKRWFWAIAIILRHIKKPQPACFANPLYRSTRLGSTQPDAKIYPHLLDYDSPPPVTNTGTITTHLSPHATQTLHTLCRASNASIGAGCFVLIALSMMQLYERYSPHIELNDRKPFIGSFPINPRPFFEHYEKPDSCMLAFSDGVVLPFLPSSMEYKKRFGVLVREVSRQLKRFQKRGVVVRSDAGEMSSSASSASTQSSSSSSRLQTKPLIQQQILPSLHLQLASMLSQKIPPFTPTFPPFLYPPPPSETSSPSSATNSPSFPLPRPNPTLATCGISSVGRSPFRYNPRQHENKAKDKEPNADEDKTSTNSLHQARDEEDTHFKAWYKESRQNVRAREGEFLVGVSGGGGGSDDRSARVEINVSYDQGAIDEGKVEEWIELLGVGLEGLMMARL